MGDLFRKQQAKNFQKGRDRALEEAGRPRLFQRPDIVRTVFTIQPLDGVALIAGERLFALTEDSAGPVFAVRDHQKVGILDGDGALILREALIASEGPGIAVLQITTVFELSGSASAEVVPDAA